MANLVCSLALVREAAQVLLRLGSSVSVTFSVSQLKAQAQLSAQGVLRAQGPAQAAKLRAEGGVRVLSGQSAQDRGACSGAQA